MSGPPRDPTDTKIIRGTFRKGREEAAVAREEVAKTAEPEFGRLDSFPKPPLRLGRQGRELWQRLGGELFRSGVLRIPDVFALELLCINWQQVQNLKRIQQDVPTSLTNTLASMFAQFGVTPSSRQRIAKRLADAPPPAPKNPFSGHGKRPGDPS